MDRIFIAAASVALGLGVLWAGGCAPGLTVVQGGDGGVAGGGGSAGGAACTKPSDCGEVTACGTPACDDGVCSWTGVKDEGDQPAELMNVAGDCQIIQCNGTGQVQTLEMQDSDVFPYGNPCYQDDCGAGLTRPPANVGAACGAGFCSNEGRCVQCTSDSHCTSGKKCDNGTCAADPQCFNGTKDGTETDIDCGGACGPCAANAACGGNDDCQSGSCSGGTCAPPDCGDFVRNGDETDFDCGGSCTKKCGGVGAMTELCLIHADCVAGTSCISGKCQ